MSYDYKTEKPKVLTDEGQKMFLKVRDHTKHLIALAGVARCQEMIRTCGGGDGWTMLACVDRLVELGEIVEIIPDGRKSMGQYRIFRAPYTD